LSAKVTPSYRISKPIVTIDESKTIGEAIELMNSSKLSCLLLVNAAEEIVGVLTERDVLRRLTLLDMTDKLTRAVGTIATREVLFADADNVHESIVRLHFEKGLRHFPVLRGTEHKLANIVGIVTMTDLVRAYLSDEVKRRNEHVAKAEAPEKQVGVICHKPVLLERYREIFGPAGFTLFHIEDPSAFFRANLHGGIPLIFDFDGFGRGELSKLVPPTKKYPGHLVMAASDPNIVRLFQPYMDHARQTVALKPLDADYLVWLLDAKWRLDVA